MMNQGNGWMNWWVGPEMWVWTVLGVILLVLLAIAVIKLIKK